MTRSTNSPSPVGRERRRPSVSRRDGSIVIAVPRQVLFSSGWGGARRRGVFVAYRFDDADSQRFRQDLEKAIHKQAALDGVAVLDGHVPAGRSWPRDVRTRLGVSSLVVADLTGARTEVVFEAGFACGRDLPVIVATHSASDRTQVPGWLHELQFRPFDDAVAVGRIVQDIEEHFSNKSPVGALRVARVVPQRATIVGDSAAFAEVAATAERRLSQGEMTVERLSVVLRPGGTSQVPWRSVERAAGSAVVVLFLDGGEGAVLAHFIAGAVAARPNPRPGKVKLQRSVIVVTPPGVTTSLVVAAGLSRCDDSLVTVVPASDTNALLTAFDASVGLVRTWRKKAAEVAALTHATPSKGSGT